MSEQINLAELPRQSRHSLDLDVARLADGTPLRLPVNIVVGKADGPCLALVAGVHGDESEGVLGLMELWDELDPASFTGRVVLVPVANPPAFAAHRRTSPLDGLDLNRIFPGKADGSPSERLAHRLYESVLRHCDFLFSLHSWYSAGVVLPYVEFKHDIRTARVSLEAAKASGFDLIRISEWSPGLMTRVVNEAGVPGMEAEIGGTGITTPENRALYKARVRALMGHLGMAAASPQPTNPARLVDHLDLMAPDGGVLMIMTRLGAEVTAGEKLAQISDLHNRSVAEVRSKGDGLIGAMRVAGSVQAGELVFRIFRDVSLDI
jgi:N-alpha-acetyl-L-2,4-diaminobutyrate deacetylase